MHRNHGSHKHSHRRLRRKRQRYVSGDRGSCELPEGCKSPRPSAHLPLRISQLQPYRSGSRKELQPMINFSSKSPSSQQGTARYTLFLVLGCVTLLALGCGNSSTTPVPGRHLLTITLQPATAEATAPTGTLPFTASGTFDQPPATEDNLAVQWTSSDPSVATIDSTGTATCVAVGGPVTIMASSSQKSGTAQLDCVSVPQVGSGNCAYMCGGTRCGALTGYCSL